MSGSTIANDVGGGSWVWQWFSSRFEHLWRSLGELMGYCDVSCGKGHRVDGNVWYADQFLYPNHWQPGSKLQPRLVDDGQPQSWFNAWARIAPIRLALLFLALLVITAFL